MAILGTKKFWRAVNGNTLNQKENQILKNAGYISIQLRTVNYMSKGSFWQGIFGGRDKIALTTSIKYLNAGRSVEASTVQDVREVKVNANYNFGIQRDLAIKIPANADSLAIEVRMIAVKKDLLQTKFELFNQPDYQSALQLAPKIVGGVLTITSLIKRLFSETDPKVVLEAGFAGIISLEAEEQPVRNGKLAKGQLIMVSTDEGKRYDDVDESNFELKGDTLYFEGNQVENTYLVFNIGFDALRGADENSLWFRKYIESVAYLDRIYQMGLGLAAGELFQNDVEDSRILKASLDLWMEGNALLDADENYINVERINLKNAARIAIMQKYRELLPNRPVSNNLPSPTDMLKVMTGALGTSIIEEAFPLTGGYVHDLLHAKGAEGLVALADLATKEEQSILNGMLERDNGHYLFALHNYDIGFDLGKIDLT